MCSVFSPNLGAKPEFCFNEISLLEGQQSHSCYLATVADQEVKSAGSFAFLTL